VPWSIRGSSSENNFDKEACIARKVLHNLFTSSSKGTFENNDSIRRRRTKRLDVIKLSRMQMEKSI